MMSQNPREGAAAQRYELRLVPTSRGHCCSIHVSKSLFWDLLLLFSLMFHRVSIYLDNLLHLQSAVWLRTENFWDFWTQIATLLSPRSWKERAFCHASFQPGMHWSWKHCSLALALQTLCVLGKWSAGRIHYGSVISESFTCTWNIRKCYAVFETKEADAAAEGLVEKIWFVQAFPGIRCGGGSWGINLLIQRSSKRNASSHRHRAALSHVQKGRGAPRRCWTWKGVLACVP